MKVLLYFEKQDKIKKSGIGRALQHQITAVTSAGLEYTLDPNDTFDIAHINTYFPASKRLVKKLKRKGVPVIVHGHSTKEDFRESFAFWKVMALWFYPNLMWFYKNADYIITPTEYSKGLIENYKKSVPVKAISNGIAPEEYVYKEENVKAFRDFFGFKKDDRVVMSAGFYFKRKGLHDFIEVAREFPDIKFVWFGYLRPLGRTRFIKKAIKNKPSNVYLPGYVPGPVIKGAFHSSECFFFPSYEENEGIVVLEGLVCNRPVLLRDVGVYKGWTEDGVNCYKAKDNQEFAEKLAYILGHDNSEIIKNGQVLVEERTLDKIGLQLKETYEKVIEDYKNKHSKK
jgi:1,2-diacylglycerol-3-alpha-glucose alpha-1,2-glucosyltransferase